MACDVESIEAYARSEDIVADETMDVHVARMRYFADVSLVIEAEVRDVFETAKMTAILL